MTQKELSNLFPATCRIGELILLISPDRFHKLNGVTIKNCRMFIMICEGTLKLMLNDRPYEVSANSYFDIIETNTARIDSISPDLRGWCLFVSFEFASESLKNLRPGPLPYSLECKEIPIWHFTEGEFILLERQLYLLNDILDRTTHYFRQELTELYFKSFSLELGNIMLLYQQEKSDIPPLLQQARFHHTQLHETSLETFCQRTSHRILRRFPMHLYQAPHPCHQRDDWQNSSHGHLR